MLGVRVDDLAARRIAADWHAGGGSPSYQFVSTGRITDDLAYEVEDCIRFARTRSRIFTDTDLTELHRLLVYIRHHGPRPALPGWSGLTW